jgi:hypothetical protein
MNVPTILFRLGRRAAAEKGRLICGSSPGRWGRCSLLLREPGLRLENLHLMFGEYFGGRYKGQVRKGRPHGYGQLGEPIHPPLLDTWLQLDRSTALYIYKAKHCKLLVYSIMHKIQNLYLNNIYLAKIYFKLSITEILKILENGPFC